MTELFKVGELVQYYKPKHDATVVGRIMELPSKHKKSVVIRVVESPYPHLIRQEWPVPLDWVLRAGGHPQAFAGGGVSYEDHLAEIRDRVLPNLTRDLQPVGCTKRPTKELRLEYNPEWTAYQIWTHPRDLELKLTLGIKDKAKRELAYDLLRKRQSEITAALGEVQFNWRRDPPRTVFEEITWPGEDGPRFMDIDRIVERLTLYITTIQPIFKHL